MLEFKGSHFERDVILWGVRWYVAYPISYRQLEEMGLGGTESLICHPTTTVHSGLTEEARREIGTHLR